MGNVGSITAHASSTTIKERRVLELDRLEPVPVLQSVSASTQTRLGVENTYRLGTLVATLSPQCGLVGPGEVPVPCEEVSLSRMVTIEAT